MFFVCACVGSVWSTRYRWISQPMYLLPYYRLPEQDERKTCTTQTSSETSKQKRAEVKVRTQGQSPGHRPERFESLKFQDDSSASVEPQTCNLVAISNSQAKRMKPQVLQFEKRLIDKLQEKGTWPSLIRDHGSPRIRSVLLRARAGVFD